MKSIAIAGFITGKNCLSFLAKLKADFAGFNSFLPSIPAPCLKKFSQPKGLSEQG